MCDNLKFLHFMRMGKKGKHGRTRLCVITNTVLLYMVCTSYLMSFYDTFRFSFRFRFILPKIKSINKNNNNNTKTKSRLM